MNFKRVENIITRSLYKEGTILLVILSFIFSVHSPLYGQDSGSVLIQNGTLITITGENLENSDLLILDGVIREIGQDLSVPDGRDDVQVIDATDKFVMPGIVDAHSHLNGIGINEATHVVTPEVTMYESINPNSIEIYTALAGGVTTINLMHGSANVIGGRNATLKLRYGQSQNQMRFEGAPQTVKFALGENPTRVHGQGNNVQPRTRMAVEQVIREHFDAAIDYRRKREDYLSQKNLYDQGLADIPPVPVARNLRLEVLADIIEGNIIVHIHSYRSDEILMVTRVFEDYGITGYTFQHANEAFKVAPELREHGAHASVFSDWWAYKFEVYYSTAYNATILNANGVVTSINSDDDELIRHLNHEAAKTMRYGQTSENDALRMITINPAIQLGIDQRIGSLETGKDGDISIWNGHPLSIYSINEMTLVDGTVFFNRSEDPDDMRIDVDPATSYEDTQSVLFENSYGRHTDACLQDVFMLFDTEENREFLLEQMNGGE